jgi:hypothetical protein
MRPKQHWGLLALGRSGQIEIDVDQTCVGKEMFTLEISSRSWSLRCQIRQPEVIRVMASFLAEGKRDTMTIGTLGGMPVLLRRDREFADRFFIVVASGGHGDRLQFTVAGDSEVSDLSTALLQAAADLKVRRLAHIL